MDIVLKVFKHMKYLRFPCSICRNMNFKCTMISNVCILKKKREKKKREKWNHFTDKIIVTRHVIFHIL